MQRDIRRVSQVDVHEGEGGAGEGATPWSATVIVDSNFLPVFQCWHSAYRKSGSRTPVIVGALDAQAFTTLSVQLQSLWGDVSSAGERFQVIDLSPDVGLLPDGTDISPEPAPSLLEADISPRSFKRVFWKTMRESIAGRPGGSLHSDADALWVRSPDDMLRRLVEEHPDTDIISQVSFGATWHHAFESWGFVLNSGFTLFRNTSAVLEMVDTFAAVNQTEFEQGVLNEYLLELGCAWGEPVTPDSRSASAGRCGNLKVLALPAFEVSREWDKHPYVNVFHPDLRRIPLDKLQSEGLC